MRGLEHGIARSILQALRHLLDGAEAQTDLALLRSNMQLFSNDVPHFR